MRADDVRFHDLKRLVIQTHFCGLAAPEVVPHNVTGADQLMKQRAALIAFEIQGDTALRQIERLKISAVVLGEAHRARLPRRVAAG